MTGPTTGSTPPHAATLPAGHVAMIGRGVSTVVASRDAAHRPSLMRAVGVSITADAQQITVYLSRPSSARLLADLQATGQIAVVFTEPFSHQAVQVKASTIEIRLATADDAPVLARYLASMEHELDRIGFGPHCTRAMLSHRLDEVVAVTFRPELAFEQTPGLRAGTRLPPHGDSP